MAAVIELSTPYGFERTDETRLGNSYVGPADAAAAAERLVEEFASEKLIAAGVCQQADGQPLRLCETFTSEAGPLIALRAADAAPPFALLTSHGVWPRGRAIWGQVFDDQFTCQNLPQSAGLLLLTPQVGQAAAFRNCGMPALPWLNLASGKLRDLSQLQAACRGRRPLPGTVGRTPRIAAATNVAGAAHVDRDPPPRPAPAGADAVCVLAGWSPAGWSDADETALQQAASAVARVERRVPERAPRIGVWRPQNPSGLAAEMANYACQNRCVPINRSLAADMWYAAAWVAACRGGADPPTYEEAAAQYAEAERYYGWCRDAPELSERRVALEAAIERQFVGRQYAAAAAAADPLEAAAYGASAQVTYGLFAAAPAVRAALADVVRNPSPAALERLSVLQRSQARSVSQVVQLARLLRRRQ